MGDGALRAVNFTLLLLVTFVVAGCATKDCACSGTRAEPHLSLQLPPEFSCKIENKDHVCVTATRDRYVIYAMKIKGNEDTLELYKARFPQAKIVEINGVKWVDATRTPGEMPGYSTRYLATVDEDIAVLVTFTARDEQFAKFNEDLKPVIGGLILRR